MVSFEAFPSSVTTTSSPPSPEEGSLLERKITHAPRELKQFWNTFFPVDRML